MTPVEYIAQIRRQLWEIDHSASSLPAWFIRSWHENLVRVNRRSSYQSGLGYVIQFDCRIPVHDLTDIKISQIGIQFQIDQQHRVILTNWDSEIDDFRRYTGLYLQFDSGTHWDLPDYDPFWDDVLTNPRLWHTVSRTLGVTVSSSLHSEYLNNQDIILISVAPAACDAVRAQLAPLGRQLWSLGQQELS